MRLSFACVRVRHINKLRAPMWLARMTLGVCVATSAVAIAMPASSSAHDMPRVLSAVNASTTSPWHGLNCETPTVYSSGMPQMDETTLAVNPRNPLEQSTAWIDNDSGPVDTAFTEDGGRTWHKAPLVGLDPCTGLVNTNGHAYEGEADPWLSYGIDGTLYIATEPFANYFTAPQSTYIEPVVVEHAGNSSDWSLPSYMPDPFTAQDKPAVLADNSNASDVYTISVNTSAGAPIGSRGDGQLLFARSTDGGNTFTDTVLADANSTTANFGNPQILQLADGTLAAGGRFPASLGGGQRFFHSSDRGVTWSSAGAPQPSAGSSASIGPLCGTPVSFSGTGGQAAVLDGKTLLSVQAINGTRTGPSHIVLFRSDDAGQTWTSSTVYTSSFPIAYPSVATDRGGRIGMVFYQANTVAETCSPVPTLPARSEFVVSTDKGRTWSRPARIGAGWWNFGSGVPIPWRGSYAIGDYEQVAAVPGQGFAVSAVQGLPLADAAGSPAITGLESVIVAEIAVNSGHQERTARHRRH
jgi:hypothetical protein